MGQALRAVGLAPSTAQTYPTEASKVAARQAEFDAMDVDRTGFITFDKFLTGRFNTLHRKCKMRRVVCASHQQRPRRNMCSQHQCSMQQLPPTLLPPPTQLLPPTQLHQPTQLLP